jgi:hypothetical protein
MDVVSLHPGDTRCRDGLSASSELPRRKSAGVRRRGQRFADKRMRRYSTPTRPWSTTWSATGRTRRRRRKRVAAIAGLVLGDLVITEHAPSE